MVNPDQYEREASHTSHILMDCQPFLTGCEGSKRNQMLVLVNNYDCDCDRKITNSSPNRIKCTYRSAKCNQAPTPFLDLPE